MKKFGVRIPNDQVALLEEAVAGLAQVHGVVAVALGGSHARGVAHAGSDLDVGIYYREGLALDIAGVREVAFKICSAGTVPLVTELYGWGPWVNGGAWIETPVTKVDFVYRNVEQVRRVIEEGKQGVWRHDYDQQPPFGFRSVVYFAETQYCVALHDPHGEIAALKESVREYPEALRDVVLREGLWGAEFSLLMCRGYAASGDVCNSVGCFARVAHYLTQALFAMNRVYFLNEKQVNRILVEMELVPVDFVARLGSVLGGAGQDAAGLSRSLELLYGLWAEVVALTGGGYQARFDLSIKSSST